MSCLDFLDIHCLVHTLTAKQIDAKLLMSDDAMEVDFFSLKEGRAAKSMIQGVTLIEVVFGEQVQIKEYTFSTSQLKPD